MADAHEFLMKLVERADAEAATLAKRKKRRGGKKAAEATAHSQPSDAPTSDDGWTSVARGGKAVVVQTVGGTTAREWGPLMRAFGVLLVAQKRAVRTLEPAVGLSLAHLADVAALRCSVAPLVLCVHLQRSATAGGRLRRADDAELSDTLALAVEDGPHRETVHYFLRSIVFHVR